MCGGGLWMAVRVRVALTEGVGAGGVRGGARGGGVTEAPEPLVLLEEANVQRGRVAGKTP